MKILRLSLFNLRKNKREAAAIVFLTMVTVFLLGTAFISITKLGDIFNKAYDETGCMDYIIHFRKDSYREVYKDILEEEYGIEDSVEANGLFAIPLNVMEKNGGKQLHNFGFISLETEKKTEGFDIQDGRSDDDISDIEHPIWLPYAFEMNDGYVPGDTYTIIIGGRTYPFEIAGFYNPGCGNRDGSAMKVIVTDKDFNLLSGVLENTDILAFNGTDDFDINEFLHKCEELSGENVTSYAWAWCRKFESENEVIFLQIFMGIAAFVSFITLASTVFLMRHKISNDIEDQMQQIGVLEALGYRSGEISLSYIYEYMLTAAAGAVLGTVLSIVFNPVLSKIAGKQMGRIVHMDLNPVMLIAVAFSIVLLTLVFALTKAATIKRYPPVVAFRKGIKTHHFGRNILPLEKTKGNINTRLAFKAFFRNIKQNIGSGICILLATSSLVFGVAVYDFFRDEMAMLYTMGMEVPEEMIFLLDGVDPYAFSEELLELPEVRKTLVSFDTDGVTVEEIGSESDVVSYEDFSETENIFLSDGRYPEHENEIGISLYASRTYGIEVGDSVTVKGDGTRKTMIVTGIIPEASNSLVNVYLTHEGYLSLIPNDTPKVIEVYLEEGVDRNDFERKLYGLYGASAAEMAEANAEGSTLEERIRNAADEQMAILLDRYGITDVDYAIRIGDQLITGQSSVFRIRDIQSTFDQIATQVTPMAKAVKAFVIGMTVFVGMIVAVILSILSFSNVRRQRKDLGIMKSMGYSSKDLMKQLAVAMLPSTIVSTAAGTVLGVLINHIFWLSVMGFIVRASVPMVIATAVLTVLFSYAVTYFAAGKVKKVSVTELITE